MLWWPQAINLKGFDMPSTGNTLPASQVALDTHATIRQLIEKANLAVFEAARAISAAGDPVGASLFGVDEATLQAFGAIPKSKILPILQTGVPLFELRLKSPDAIKELVDAKGFNTDRLFALLMQSFDTMPSLKQL